MATQVLPTGESVVDDGRYEFARGRLIERPLPGIPHAHLQKRMVRLLDGRLESTGRSTYSELSIDRTSDAKSEWLTPDVLVSNPGGFLMKQSNQHALPPVFLAIEILSPGQSFMNLHWKAKDYIQWSVKHIWFLDIESSSALTYSAPNWGRGQILSEGAVAVEGIVSFEIAEIFAQADAET